MGSAAVTYFEGPGGHPGGRPAHCRVSWRPAGAGTSDAGERRPSDEMGSTRRGRRDRWRACRAAMRPSVDSGNRQRAVML